MRLRECKVGTKVHMKLSVLGKFPCSDEKSLIKHYLIFKNLFYENAIIYSIRGKSVNESDCNVTIKFRKCVWKDTFKHYLGRCYLSVNNRDIEKISKKIIRNERIE